MQEKQLITKKSKLIKKLNELAKTMIAGSLYEITVNCKIESCKLCQDGKRGHKSNRLGYYTSKKTKKIMYVSTKDASKVKKDVNCFKEAKKLLTEIGEINLLIMKKNEISLSNNLAHA